MNKKIVPLLVLALIGGALAYSSGMFSLISGFTINSISLANPPVQGQPNEWIINAVVNGWGQTITGNLGATDIKYSGATAKYPLSITGEISSNTGYYLISNENPRVVKKYRVEQKTGTVNNYIVYVDAKPAPACDGSPDYSMSVKSPSGWLGLGTTNIIRICVYGDNVGVIAPISSMPNIVPKIIITATINGQSQKVELNSLGIKTLPNGLGSVAWTNSPVESTSSGALSIGNQYMAFGGLNTEGWKAVYSNDYSGGVQSYTGNQVSMDSTFKSYMQSYIDYSNIGCSQYNLDNEGISLAASCVNKYITSLTTTTNYYANKLATSNVNINNRFTTYSEQSATNRGFVVDLGNIYASSPNLQIRIKSDWIGIEFPKGIPQVISASASPTPFRAGDALTATITVKNIGDGRGSFIIQDFSCGSIIPSGSIYPLSLEPQATGTITTKFLSSVSTSESGTCSGNVVDTGSLKSARWSFSYQMIKPAECKEGEKQVFGKKIQDCKNGVLVDVEYCDWGVNTDSSGNYVCAPKPDICKTAPNDPSCQKGGGEFPIPLTYIIFPALGGLLLYLSNKKEILWGIVGAIIGLIAAFIVDYLLKNILLTIFGVVFGGIVIWLLIGGGLMTVAAFIVAIRKK